MMTLPQIIQNECIPRRNCLLSVTDISGETGFLYFKDSELIEANHTTIWGQQAFLVIAQWKIANYSVNELPMGIKRTLWEPIDKLLDEVFGDSVGANIQNQPLPVTASPTLGKSKSETQQLAFSKLYALPGFLALFLETSGNISLIHATPQKPHPSEPWLNKLIQQFQNLSKVLGTGYLREFYLKTDSFCGWRIPIGKEVIFLFASPEIDQETFAQSLQEALAPIL